MIVVAALAQGVETGTNRYHQHLEAQEKEACTEHGEETFCTHLPLINIVTDAEMPEPHLFYEDEIVDEDGTTSAAIVRERNYEMVAAKVEYFDESRKNNHLTDKAKVESDALIRVRGASSREFDKKNYLLKFTEEDMVTSKDVSLSGMTEDNEWVLHGPFLDKTLIRNYLCYNLAGEIMDYAPNVRFCEAFINGEYMGLYLITEKVEYNKQGRIHLEKTDPDIATTPYILEMDRGTEDETRKITTFGNHSYLTAEEGAELGQLEVIYPSKTLTEEQRKFIERDFSQFEKAIFSLDYDDKKKGYRKYIDVESFIDYFLINEFTLNYDAVGYSTYLYKDVGDKLKMCVWDFNSAFDYYEYSVISPETFVLQNSMWYNALFRDENFVQKVEDRYYVLREKYFNEVYLNNYIDETVAYLGAAIDRNYEKWGYSFKSEHNGFVYDYLKPVERNVRSYEEAIEQLKDCIEERIEHMDRNIDRLYILCHDSLNKSANNNSEGN